MLTIFGVALLFTIVVTYKFFKGSMPYEYPPIDLENFEIK